MSNKKLEEVILNKLVLHLGRTLKLVESMYVENYLSDVQITPNISLNLAIDYHVGKILRYFQNNLNTNLANLDTTNLANLDTTTTSAELETLYSLQMSALTLSKNITPKSNLKYNYLFLDSNNCHSILDNTKFTWLINEENLNYTKGYINLHAKLRNICMARIGRVHYTHVHADVIDICNSSRRISLYFEEFASQALISPSGVKFQFLVNKRSSDIGQGANFTLSPFNQNRGWFRFRELYQRLDKLTLTMWDLFGPLEQRISMPDTYLTFTGVQSYDYSVDGVDLEQIEDPLIIPNIEKYIARIYNVYPSFAREQVIISGFSVIKEYILDDDTGELVPVYDLDIMNQYNGLHTLEIGNTNYCIPPAPLGIYIPSEPENWPTVTIRLLYKPRFTTVLELISMDADD